MFAKSVVCFSCGERYGLGDMVYRCGRCGGSLDIEYDYGAMRSALDRNALKKERVAHWKYRAFYPMGMDATVISMGEGGTPLVKSPNLGFANLLLKLECNNPTGSFKDRGSTVEMTRAVSCGASKVCCASTGNMGASVAAYAARAGIECRVFVPRSTARQKLAQMAAYGADVRTVRGYYTDALAAAERESRKGFYIMGDYPYRGEGEKSVGFEIADQLGWRAPDYVACPMGNGTLIYAVWKALKELKICNMIGKLPKLIGVQAFGCAPIATAFMRNAPIEPVARPRTVASAVACGEPIDGPEAVAAIRESGGVALTVSDAEILRARKLLATREGVFAEAGGAVATAGLLKLMKASPAIAKKSIVSVVSGHGLKDA